MAPIICILCIIPVISHSGQFSVGHCLINYVAESLISDICLLPLTSYRWQVRWPQFYNLEIKPVLIMYNCMVAWQDNTYYYQIWWLFSLARNLVEWSFSSRLPNSKFKAMMFEVYINIFPYWYDNSFMFMVVSALLENDLSKLLCH